jgi:hypothetical protein
VPEEPKKIVPEKKVPVIKKPEAPPPKGSYIKINIYVLFVSDIHTLSLLCIVLYYVFINCFLYVMVFKRLVKLM